MIDHLSPSSLNMYLRCGVQWEYRYVQGLVIPPGGPLIRGKALDEAATLHYREKARGHGLERAEFVEAAVSAHETILENEETTLDMTPGKSKDIVTVAAGGYYRGIATKLVPRSREDVQRKVAAQLDGFEVLGYIDLITKPGGIVDTKLRDRIPWQSSVDADVQLGTYSWLTGLRTVALAVVRPNGETAMVWSERTERDDVRLRALYERVWRCIQSGVAVPAQPDSWCCCERWCGYWARCTYGGK